MKWNKVRRWELEEKYAIPLEHAAEQLLERLQVSNINETLDSFTHEMIQTSQSNLPRQKPQSWVVQRGWQSISKCHETRETTKDSGRPRSQDNQLRRDYLESKKQFRKELRFSRAKLTASRYQQILDANNKENDVDSELFHRLVGENRKTREVVTDKLVVNGKIYQDEDLPDGWAEYFSCFATPKPTGDHATNIADLTDSILELEQSSSEAPEDKITTDEVNAALKKLNRNKAPWMDEVTTEHL